MCLLPLLDLRTLCRTARASFELVAGLTCVTSILYLYLYFEMLVSSLPWGK